MSGSKLIDTFALHESSLFSGNLLVCKENGIKVNGKFVLYHLLKEFFDRYGEEARAILLTSESKSVWENSLHQLGFDLNKVIGNGNIQVLDVPQLLYETLLKNVHQEAEIQHHPKLNDEEREVNLKILHSRCVELMDKLNDLNRNADTKVIIVVESLTSLTASLSDRSGYHFKHAELFQFLIKLKKLSIRKSSLGFVACCLNSAGGDVSQIVSHVMATSLVQVYPLKTGSSPLFHGYLSFQRLAEGDEDKECGVSYYQYKLDSKAVQLIQCLNKVEV